MPRFELEEGSASKFWDIEQNGKQLVICFGRIGSKGQKQLKKLASEAAVTKELEKLVAAKTKKGYQPVGAAPRASAKKGAKAAAPAAAGTNPELEQAIQGDRRRRIPRAGSCAVRVTGMVPHSGSGPGWGDGLHFGSHLC